jgi:hypothetical protein
MNMAEDFGDSTGSGLVNTAKQAAKEVVQAVVTKGAGIGGKGGVLYAIACSFPSEAFAWLPIITY